jgi:hypothetical protein
VNGPDTVSGTFTNTAPTSASAKAAMMTYANPRATQWGGVVSRKGWAESSGMF